jgi:hypothetical protein
MLWSWSAGQYNTNTGRIEPIQHLIDCLLGATLGDICNMREKYMKSTANKICRRIPSTRTGEGGVGENDMHGSQAETL